eukprot:2659733-Rhodomonas_salina.1
MISLSHLQDAGLGRRPLRQGGGRLHTAASLRRSRRLRAAKEPSDGISREENRTRTCTRTHRLQGRGAHALAHALAHARTHRDSKTADPGLLRNFAASLRCGRRNAEGREERAREQQRRKKERAREKKNVAMFIPER